MYALSFFTASVTSYKVRSCVPPERRSWRALEAYRTQHKSVSTLYISTLQSGCHLWCVADPEVDPHKLFYQVAAAAFAHSIRADHLLAIQLRRRCGDLFASRFMAQEEASSEYYLDSLQL